MVLGLAIARQLPGLCCPGSGCGHSVTDSSAQVGRDAVGLGRAAADAPGPSWRAANKLLTDSPARGGRSGAGERPTFGHDRRAMTAFGTKRREGAQSGAVRPRPAVSVQRDIAVRHVGRRPALPWWRAQVAGRRNPVGSAALNLHFVIASNRIRRSDPIPTQRDRPTRWVLRVMEEAGHVAADGRLSCWLLPPCWLRVEARRAVAPRPAERRRAPLGARPLRSG